MRLAVRFQEHESSIRRGFLLSTFGDSPSFVLIIVDLAVLSRNGLELELDVTLRRSTNSLSQAGYVSKYIDEDVNFILNPFSVFLGADP